jgi:sialic acid synthase SpsE
MRERYNPLPIGYSGHETGFIPTIAAVALGATTVERHFTLDKSLPGPDHSTVSLDPSEFGAMVREIRRVENGMRDNKIYIHEREVRHREKHGKSIVAKTLIPVGAVITESMISFKSPGSGITPTLVAQVLGKKTKREIEEDTLISWDALE